MAKTGAAGQDQAVLRPYLIIDYFRRMNPRSRAMWKMRLQRTGVALIFCAAIAWLTSQMWGQHVWTRLAAGTEKAIDAAAVRHGFVVDEITLAGRVNQDTQSILSAIGVTRGDTMTALDMNAMREALVTLPWVADARVARRFPHELIITLQERVPVALWQYKGRIMLIDAGGNAIIPATRDGIYANLPLVVGAEAQEHVGEIMTYLAAEPDIAQRLDAAMRMGNRRWDLRLKNGVTVKLPEKNVPLALARLAKAQETQQILDQPLNFVDVRIENKTILGRRTEQ